MVDIREIIKNWDIKCVILDLDGTLVDTLEIHVKAFLRVTKEMGIEVPRERIEQNMGRMAIDVLQTIVPEIKEPELAYYAKRKEDILTELLGEVHQLPGAVELLRELKLYGLPLVLASSTTLRNVTRILQVAGLSGYIDKMVTAEDVVVGKPNPDVFIRAASKGGVSPKRSLLIGDSIHDIAAAMAAGCFTIAVASGMHTIEQLSVLKPNLIVRNLTELL